MTGHEAPFADRREAGRKLAAALEGYRGDDLIVLALPRGGVPVGFEIADALGAPLDLLLVRKLGAPGHPEYGIGAIVDGAHPKIVLNDEAVRLTGASRAYIDATAAAELAELERRRRVYRGEADAPDLRGRTVIVVDDGIATGGTVKAALQGLQKAGAAKVVLAVPVAPPESLRELSGFCDAIVCLRSPSHFRAVGAHYIDFSQTEDAEVIDLLAKSRQLAGG